MAQQREPERGDLVEVHWLDINEDSNGDTAKATLCRRISVSYFWEFKDDHGVPVLVTCTTIDADSTVDQGWCAFPRTCITGLYVIRRARKPRRPRAAVVKADQHERK